MPNLSRRDKAGKVTSTEARRRRDVALAQLREYQVRKLHGELVETVTVEAEWTSIAVHFRDAVLGLPARVVNRLPAEWRREVSTVVDEEARAVLTALSDQLRADKRKRK